MPNSNISELAAFGGNPVISDGEIHVWPYPNSLHENALLEVLETGRYHRVNHPIVIKLEKAIEEWCGIQARAVSSGTAAIHIALDYFCNDKKDNLQVLTSALNWPGAVGPIYFSNMSPYFIDISLENACMDEQLANNYISDKTVSGILVTHLFGNICKLGSLRKRIQKDITTFIIDDCAQAIGAIHEFRDSSSAIITSGNGSKHLGAGELGILCSMKEMIINHVDSVSLASSSRNGERIFHPMTYGYNYRPNVFSAAISLSRMESIDEQLRVRRQNCISLMNRLSKLSGIYPLFSMKEEANSFCVLPLRLEFNEMNLPESGAIRDRIVELLVKEGVPASVWLRKPVWEYMPFPSEQWCIEDFPNTNKLLKTFFYIREIAPPNDEQTMILIAQAFEKVWERLSSLKDWLIK